MAQQDDSTAKAAQQISDTVGKIANPLGLGAGAAGPIAGKGITKVAKVATPHQRTNKRVSMASRSNKRMITRRYLDRMRSR